MPDANRQVIPEETMLARLERSEQMREFFIQMWLQNPVLARQAGARVRELLTALPAADQPPASSTAPAR